MDGRVGAPGAPAVRLAGRAAEPLERPAQPEVAGGERVRLAELPGIGPWTISYILMRAVGDPDAFPASDLGLRRALERLGGTASAPDRWRPWRAYAAVHLWTWSAGRPATDGGSAPIARPADIDRLAAK